jgi:hypothetical protein
MNELRTKRGKKEAIDDAEEAAISDLRKALNGQPSRQARGAAKRALKERTELTADAPAPRTGAAIAAHGPEPCAAAISAWERRINGEPILHVAHEMGLSIGAAKALIREVHDAIYEDLKDNLALNRQLDLERIDGLVRAFYPAAASGDIDSATVTLKALAHRAKLTGLEPMPDAGRSKPENVLVWVQTQLPQITKIVDSLPLELPPSAP